MVTVARLAGVDAVRQTSAAFLTRTVVEVAVSLVTSAFADRIPAFQFALLVAEFEFFTFYAEVGLFWGRKEEEKINYKELRLGLAKRSSCPG